MAFVFGGLVHGLVVAEEHEPDALTKPDNDSAPDATAAELQKLAQKEAALIAELAATRQALQAEARGPASWAHGRKKPPHATAHHPGRWSPVRVGDRPQLLRQNYVGGSSLRRPRATTVAASGASSLQVLPTLVPARTGTFEPAAAATMHAGTLSRARQSHQSHSRPSSGPSLGTALPSPLMPSASLPVFRLPSVAEELERRRAQAAAAAAAAEAAQHETEEEAARRLAAEKEAEELAQALGLSVEAVHAAQGLRSKPGTPAVGDGVDVPTPQPAVATVMALPPLLQSKAAKAKTGKHKRTKEVPVRSLPHNPALLKQELTRAIMSVQSLTTAVQEDIAEVQRLCPITNIRAQKFMRKWGMKKFERIFTRMENAFILSAFRTWRDNVAAIVLAEAADKVTRYKKQKTIARLLRNYEMKDLSRGFDQWFAVVRAEKAAERFVVEDAAARTLQRIARGMLARCRVRRLRGAESALMRRLAAERIQSWWHQRDAKRRGKVMVQKIKRGKAAVAIQRIVRGRLGRQRVKRVRIHRKRTVAATKIESVARGRQARKRVKRIRLERRRNEAATAIQRIGRGLLARDRVDKIRRERARQRAATRIQALMRGFLTRKKLKVSRNASKSYHIRLNQAALRVQTIWRAHRGRLAYHLRRQAQRSMDRERNRAATKIQATWRGRHGRMSVMERIKANAKRMIQDARLWREFWDSTNNTMFFYCEETQESAWEPPSSGYTKLDGRLVLANGDVITDPDAQAKEDPKCVECKKDATRHCDQCDDPYCPSCFDRTHAGGKRAAHTWRQCGTPKCVECETEKATKFCEVCDDPFCDNCFTLIHKRGKKAAHEWHPLSHHSDWEAQQAADLAAAADDSYYVDSGYDANYYGAAANATQWVQYFDDASQLPYWYNTATGATTWESPW